MKRTWLALTVLLASVGVPLLCSGPSQGQSRDPRLWGCMRHELLPIETVPWYDDLPACWTEAKPAQPGEVDATGPAEPLAADVEATVRQAPSGLPSHGSSTGSVTDHADTLCGSQEVHHDRCFDDAAVPVDYYLSGYDPQYDRIVYGGQSVEEADQQVAEGFLPFDGEPESLAEYYVLYGVEHPACECLLAPAVRVYSDSWESSDGCPGSEVRPHQAVAATPHADRTVPALLRALYGAQQIAGRSLRWAVGQYRQYTTDAAVWEEAHCRLVGWWHAWRSEQIEQTAADPSVAEQVEWYEWPPRDHRQSETLPAIAQDHHGVDPQERQPLGSPSIEPTSNSDRPISVVADPRQAASVLVSVQVCGRVLVLTLDGTGRLLQNAAAQIDRLLQNTTPVAAHPDPSPTTR